MLKKLLAAALAFLLLTPLPAVAEDDQFVGLPNVLSNSDFEYYIPDNTTGVKLPIGWDDDPGKQWTKDGARAVLSDAEACSGSFSARLDSTGVNLALFAQLVKNVERRTNYVVRAKVKIAGGTGSFQFKFECFKGGTYYGDPSAEWAGQNYTTSITTTNGEWVDYVSGGYVTQDDLDNFALIVVSRGLLVYVDDIELYAVGGPGRFSLNDKYGVYYAGEATEGNAYLDLAPEYDFDETRTVFNLRNEADEVVHSKTVTGGNDVTFTYPLSLIQTGEIFHVEATMYDTVTGKLLQTSRRPVSVQNRPTDITKQGVWMVDGKPFSPVYAQGVSSNKDALNRMAEIGVNCVSCSAAWLDDCEALGLKGIVFLYGGMKIAGSDANRESTIATVKKYKDHPALATWAVMDEPSFHNDESSTQQTHEDLMRSYDIIREIDPATPISIISAPLYMEDVYNNAKYCDILSPDPYPGGMHDAATFVSDYTYYAMDAVDYAKPIFTTVQTFLWGNNWWPSHDAFRSSLYQSYFEGAIGVAYYCIEKSYGNKALYETDLWQGLIDFAEKEYELCAEHFARKETVPFNDNRDGDVWYHSFVKNGKVYMIALSRIEKKEATAEIPLVSYDGSISIDRATAHVIAGSTAADSTITDGILRATIPANGVVVYEISAAADVDDSALSWDGFHATTDYTAPHFVNASTYFADMNDHAWAASQLDSLYTANVLHEVGNFYPANNVTRGEFASYIVKALKLEGAGTDTFADIDADAFYARQVALGKEHGIFKGDEYGNFNPKAPITRQDVMVIIDRAVKLTRGEAANEKFTDWDKVSDYAKDGVAACIASKIIKGNGDGTVNPLGMTTKAEAAVIVYRVMNYKPAVETPQPVTVTEEKDEEIAYTDTPNETTLQRWSDATDLLKNLGSGDIALEKSVTKGAFEQIIANLTGVAYDAFTDDKKAITYAEAEEALVKLLGYEAYAANSGFATVAANIGLKKGIQTGTYPRGGELALLLQNAIDIPLAARTAYGAGAGETYEISDELLLSAYRDIHKYEGIVTDNYLTAPALTKAQITIGGEVFEGGSEFLGQRVLVYAESEDKQIRYIKAHKNVVITTVTEDDILPEKTTTARLGYVDANDKEASISVSGARLILNGTDKSNWTAADISTGTLTLIANDGSSADVILAEQFVNHVIDSVNTFSNTIYFKDGTNLPIDLTLRTYSLLSDKGSAITTIAALAPDSVISVAVGARNTKLIVSTRSVTGAVTETDNETVTVGGQTYALDASLTTPSIGTTYRFLLDYTQKIAAYDVQISGSRYGYLVSGALTKGLEKAPQLKIFTAEGKMQVFDIATAVLLDTQTVAADKLLTDVGLGTTVTPRLIMYETNEANAITKILLAKDGSTMDADTRASLFTCDYESYDTTGVSYVPERMKYLNARYVIADETPIFVIPEDINADNDYHLRYRDEIFNATATYYNMSLYDCDDAVVSAIVYKNIAQDTFTAESYSSALYLVYDGRGEGINTDGEPVDVFYGYNQNGKYLSYPITEDCKILFGNRTITDVSLEPQELKVGNSLIDYIPIDELNKGDMLVCLQNPQGEVSLARVLVRAKTPIQMEDAYDWRPAAGGNYSHMTFCYGTVIDRVPLGLRIAVKTFRSPTAVHERLYHDSMVAEKPAYYLYDKADSSIKKIAFTDIQKGDAVAAIRTLTATRIFMIYR